MIRKLIFLPLILLFISCTITKRVHRPGYHIQWRKIERTKKADKLDLKIKESNSTSSDDLIDLELARVNQINTETPNPILVSEIPKAHRLNSSDRDMIETNDRTSNTDHFQVQPKLREQKASSSRQSIPPIFWRTPPQNLRKLGIALMILGGMILFASLLVYLGAFSGNGSGAWLNFFLDLIDISGWFWVLFFIVIFILISYLLFLFVAHVLGGPLGGVIMGLSLLGLGLFFFILGERRRPEAPN